MDEFERVLETNFSYTQPWYLPQSKRFLFLHTLYKNGQRTLNWKGSADGRAWTAPTLIAHIEMGDYQVSFREGETDRVATASVSLTVPFAFDSANLTSQGTAALDALRAVFPAGTLSGGEQQMLAMGRALMSKPSIRRWKN